MRNGIVMLVLVVGTVALLYTFLMSPTSDTTVPYSTFLGSVADGEVKEVAQQDLRLNVTPTKDATKYTVIVPGIGFTDVYADVRAAAEKGSRRILRRSSSRASRHPRRGSGSACSSARCCPCC